MASLGIHHFPQGLEIRQGVKQNPVSDCVHYLWHHVVAWIDICLLPFCRADYCRSCWRLALSKEAWSERDWLRVSMQPDMQQSVANMISYYTGPRRDYYLKNQEKKGKINNLHVVYLHQIVKWKIIKN
jgi:hypothetical protein